MQVFLVFSCDGHHSADSMRYKGAYKTHDLAISAIETHLRSENPLNVNDLRMLALCSQTQGREENWMIGIETLDQPISEY